MGNSSLPRLFGAGLEVQARAWHCWEKSTMVDQSWQAEKTRRRCEIHACMRESLASEKSCATI